MRPAPTVSPVFTSLLALATLLLPGTIALGQTGVAPEHRAPGPAPLADLVRAVDIPYERFTLANGLTVLVHTDRKTPIVGVTTYYRVGSKNEPRGHTGFAHLYEHLFFSGSANVPNFDAPLEAAGSTQSNATTWYDRTNYVETVPTGALPLALFLESDRMGHLLAAVTQDKLDKQRGVVENEKRQDDNQPYGLVQYAVGEGLFPVGHPYRHQTIGSMADIDAATIPDVRRWFAEHYAPNNAILVLSGDIDVATARPLVERYYGDIPAGPAVQPVVAGPVTLAAPVRREMTDQVATLRLIRAWSGPGLNDPDSPALAIAMRVLGGLASSRLDNALVRGEQLAVDVSADVESHELTSIIMASMDVKPGVARAPAEAAFVAEIARFLKDGPTADELARATTTEVAEEIGGLEQVGGFGGKGATLAEGLLWSGDPAHYKAELAAIAALTPDQVRDAARRWLGRPPLLIAVSPGARTESGNTMGGWGDEGDHGSGGRPVPTPDAKAPVPPVPPSPPRAMPQVAPVAALSMPSIEHARLANGIPVTLARRGGVPKVLVSIGFDAGIAADLVDSPGTQGLMLAMLTEGTASGADAGSSAIYRPGSSHAVTRSGTDLLEAEERLGATITTGATMDTSTVTLDALTPNLGASLDLLSDVVRAPAFVPADVARVTQQRLAALADAETSPESIAVRALNPLLFGARHPYGQPGDGLGNAASLAAETPAMLRAAHDRWLRPELAHITVVGDFDMAHLLPLLEASFGDWHGPATPLPVKSIDAAVPAARPRIVLIDRPNSPQSMIVGGRVLALTGRIGGGAAGDQEALALANQVLGDDFLSRLNSDLREDKGWSYGVETAVRQPLGPRSLVVFAPVQTDRTGASIASIIADMKALPAGKPVTAQERERAVEGDIRGLPNRYETNAQVLGAIVLNERLGRPENYDATLPARWRAIDAAALDAAAKSWLQPDGMTFVVVGDAKAVLPQLKGLGLPVEVAPSASAAAG